MQKVNEKTSARLDLFVDVTVIAVLIVDFISNLYCFKAHVYAEQSTVLYFVRIAVMIIVLLIQIYEYRRNKNLFDKESKAVHISSLVVGIAFVCVSAFFVGKTHWSRDSARNMQIWTTDHLCTMVRSSY